MFNTAYEMLTTHNFAGGSAKSRLNTAQDTISVIRQGLPVSMLDKAVSIMGLTKKQFSPLVGISPRSSQRNAASRLSPQQSEHMLMIIDTLVKGEEYFGERDKALEWLKSPSPAFNGQAPISLFDTVTGIKAVSDTINKLSHGMTA